MTPCTTRACLLSLLCAIAGACGVALVVASPVQAQAGPACARPAFAPLGSVEGEWAVDWANRVAPGQFERTRATSRIESAIPGCAWVERFTATVQGRPFWAMAVITASAPDSAQRTWIDSDHGQVLLFQGGWRGDTLLFEWTRDLGERQLRLRHLYFDLSPGSFRTATYLSPSAAEGWQIVAQAVYGRAPPR